MSDPKKKSPPKPKDFIITWTPSPALQKALEAEFGDDAADVKLACVYSQYTEGEGDKAKTITAKAQAEKFLNSANAPKDAEIFVGAERQAKAKVKL